MKTKSLFRLFAKLALGMSVLLASTAFAASDRGRWLCSDCTAGIQDAVIKSPANWELLNFIKTNNNAISKGFWDVKDTVTICDGTRCVQLIYSFGNWRYNDSSTVDSKTGYKNSHNAQPPTSYIGAGPSYTVTTNGHWEVWDYYSNGSYIGTDSVYIIDSMWVTFRPKVGTEMISDIVIND